MDRARVRERDGEIHTNTNSGEAIGATTFRVLDDVVAPKARSLKYLCAKDLNYLRAEKK
jgi:hypothetical protein